jgi:hypothetical protein
MGADYLSKVRDRLVLIEKAGQTLKNQVRNANSLDGSQKQAIKSDDGRLRLTWKFNPYNLVCDTAIYRRIIECAIFKGDEKVVAADFSEFKVTESYGNKAFFQHMDDEAQHLGAIALAYLSGWDAEDLDDGNLAFLDNLVASGVVGAKKWTPLFQKFVDSHILTNSFVMIAKPFPYDVAHVEGDNFDEVKTLADEVQTIGKVRHEAEIPFSERVGMEKYGDEARTPDWTYQMSKASKFEGLRLHPEFRNFEIRNLHQPMRHDF